MSEYEISEKEVGSGKLDIPYWMDSMVKRQDKAFLKRVKALEVGEYTGHRLGTMVRLKDK